MPRVEQSSAPSGLSAHRVPPSRAERLRLQQAVERYLADHELVPPLGLDEIRSHAEAVARQACAEDVVGYLMVLLGSAVWRDTVAAVPCERRVLLLPQCLRSSRECRAQVDDLGLLCAHCGSCALGSLEQEAHDLGYVVLIAEGFTFIRQLLEQGCIDAVIGVSCMEALEKSFPVLAAEAIPSLAVPLTCDGCRDTAVDVDDVRALLRLRRPGREPRLGVEALRGRVESWFTPAAIEAVLGSDGGAPGRVSRAWLARSGKRWRPFLTAAAWQALAAEPGEDIPASVQLLAVAVECFHKASLIHDDIEDGDEVRDQAPTLHVTEGLPVALNVGDLLLGEGYRLIADCGLPPERLARVLAVAAESHRDLALGQGEELSWRRSPRALTTDWVLEVFRLKTAPAFAVALRLGALAAGADEPGEALSRFSTALGIAYQIRDDIADSRGPDGQPLWSSACLPVLTTALAFDLADEHLQSAIVEAWRRPPAPEAVRARFLALLADDRVAAKAALLFEHYRNEALRALAPLRQAPLKAFLQRAVWRLLGDGPPRP
ncbi:MAG: DUF116 domain-containing protein [Lentisphaerae bacterium]|nr:DUF116 domain-containing protein [Lentisphaerota bacterium]